MGGNFVPNTMQAKLLVRRVLCYKFSALHQYFAHVRMYSVGYQLEKAIAKCCRRKCSRKWNIKHQPEFSISSFSKMGKATHCHWCETLMLLHGIRLCNLKQIPWNFQVRLVLATIQPRLNLLNYFLWGYVKHHRYATRPVTLADLKTEIICIVEKINVAELG